MASKQPSTRAKRAATKASATKKPKVIHKTTVELPPQKLANVYRLTRRAGGTILRNKLLFAGILGIYVLLNILFAGGFGQGVDAAGAKDQFSNGLVGSLAAYSQLVVSSAGSPSEAAGVYQIFFTIFASLALIWALRQIYAKQTTRIRDAYYKGLYPIAPFVLLLIVICLQLLPMVIATALYQFVVATGVAATLLEVIIWLIVALTGTLVSAYYVSGTVIALLVVTLPDMTPVAALKLARKLTAGRRWTVLRKLLFLPLLLLIIAAVILLPLIAIYAPISQLGLLLVSPLLLAVSLSYMYALYRELVGE